MAILTKPFLHSQQRLDLEDWNLLLTSISADARGYIKQFWGNGAYILKGFAVTALNTPSPAIVVVENSTLINANGTGFSWFVGPTGASPLSASLTSSSKNYLELELSNVDGTPLPRAFWDKTASNGAGSEFSQTVNTATEVKVSVVSSTSGFSGSANRIKLAIVGTDGSNNIVSILDRRELFFRLGTASNALNSYPWVGQSEPNTPVTLTGGAGTYVVGETVTFSGGTAKVSVGGTTSISLINFTGDPTMGTSLVGGTSGASRTLVTVSDPFTGADKSIGDLKTLISALQTAIKELKGTDHWFALTYSSNKILKEYQNTFFTAGGFFRWEGTLGANTLGWDANLNMEIAGRPQPYVISSTTLTVAEGQCVYVDVPETPPVGPLTPVVAPLTSLVFQSTPKVQVLYYRKNNILYGIWDLPELTSSREATIEGSSLFDPNTILTAFGEVLVGEDGNVLIES